MKVEDSYKDYLNYLRTEKNVSDLTVDSYNSDFKIFITFLNLNKISHEVNEISISVIRKYFAYIKLKKNYANGTIRRKIHSLSSLFKYLTEMELIDKNPMLSIHAPKATENLKIYLSPEEIKTVLDAPMKFKSPNVLRDKAILMTLFYTGLRRSELLSLRIHDVNLGTNILTVINGKGRKQRIIPIIDDLSEILFIYLQSRIPISNHHLFVNDSGNQLTTTWIHLFFKKYLELTHLSNKGYTLHKCRHSFATHLIKNDTSVFAVQQLLGHSDLNTTKLYSHLDSSFLSKEIQKIPKF